MKKILVILIYLSLSAQILFASPKVYFSVRPEKGTQSNDFLIQVSVSGDKISDISTPSFDENDDMSISYVSNSVQQQIINGVISFQKTFIFKIEFKKILASGEYTLPKGSILVDGKQFRFPTKKILLESPKSGEPTSNLNENKIIPVADNFQFIQTVSNYKPYIGEQILYKVEIIAPSNLEKAQLEEFEPQGVWRERYGADEKKIRTVQNTSINSFSESWYAVKAGTIEVPERLLRAEVREFQKKRRPIIDPNSPLGDQLFNSLLPYLNQFKSVEKQLIASPFTIEVRPLPPPPNKINGFIPVGQLKITSSISAETVNIGEPVTITIQVSGDANLRPLEIINPSNFNTSEFKRYDEKPVLARTIGESNITFYKTFNISLIPLKSGYRKIPAFEIDWFNPISEKYEKFVNERFSILVQGEELPTNKKDLENKIELDKLDKDQSSTNTTIPNSLKYSIPYISRDLSIKISFLTLIITIFTIILNILRNLSINNYFINKKKIKSSHTKINNLISNSADIKDIIYEFKNSLSLKYSVDFTSLTPLEIELILNKKTDSKTALLIKNILIDYENLSLSGLSENNDNIIIKIKEALGIL